LTPEKKKKKRPKKKKNLNDLVDIESEKNQNVEVIIDQPIEKKVENNDKIGENMSHEINEATEIF
jgi:hypothetical protein